MIDELLFVTNVAAAVAVWVFLLYYLARFGWERHVVGRYIVAGVLAFTALVTAGLLRRLNTATNGHYGNHINALSAISYGVTAVVFGAAFVLLVRDARRNR